MASLDPLDFRDLLARMEGMETRDPRDTEVSSAFRVCLDPLVLPETRDPLEMMVPMANLENQALADLQEWMVMLVPLV